jgi:hypothetical protein
MREPTIPDAHTMPRRRPRNPGNVRSVPPCPRARSRPHEFLGIRLREIAPYLVQHAEQETVGDTGEKSGTAQRRARVVNPSPSVPLRRAGPVAEPGPARPQPPASHHAVNSSRTNGSSTSGASNNDSPLRPAGRNQPPWNAASTNVRFGNGRITGQMHAIQHRGRARIAHLPWSETLLINAMHDPHTRNIRSHPKCPTITIRRSLRNAARRRPRGATISGVCA